MKQLDFGFTLPLTASKDAAQIAFEVYEHELRRMFRYQRAFHSETKLSLRYQWAKRYAYHRALAVEYLAQFITLTQ